MGKLLELHCQQVGGPDFFAKGRGFFPILMPGLVGIRLKTEGQHHGDWHAEGEVYWDGGKLVENLNCEA